MDEARRRQERILETIRALAEDSGVLEQQLARVLRPADTTDEGVLSSLRRRLGFGRRRLRPVAVEDQLRARVDQAMRETRKASMLADRFAALSASLADERKTLEAARAVAEEALAKADAEILQQRIHDDVAGAGDVMGKHASSLQGLERQERLMALYVERLGVLIEGASGLLEVSGTLATDVDAFATAAARQTEALAQRVRSVGVAEDARSVIEDLEDAMSSLGGSLDEAVAFATAVASGARRSDQPDLNDALQTLVRAAEARRTTQSAKERLSS